MPKSKQISKRRAITGLDVFDFLLVVLGGVTLIVLGMLARIVLAGVP